VTAKARTMVWGRKMGYLVGDVEQAKWLPIGKHRCRSCKMPKMRYWRKDLFGFGDVLFLGNRIMGSDDILVQSTADPAIERRLIAYNGGPEFMTYIKAGRKAEIHVWTKPSPKGERRTWMLRRYAIVLGKDGLEARRIE